MNKKIKKYLDEIAKTEKKIADLQQYLRGVQAALKQEEDNEMIRCIRGMKMDNDQLYDLLDGIQSGKVKFQVSRESDDEGSGSFVFTEENKEEYQNGEMVGKSCHFTEIGNTHFYNSRLGILGHHPAISYKYLDPPSPI